MIRNSKEGHDHEYSALAWKITRAIQALSGQEVSKSYTASQVATALENPQNGNRQALHLAGGKALRSQGVRNAGLQLLKANPDPRKRVLEGAEKLEVQEIFDKLLITYNILEEDTKDWDPNLRDMAIQEWIRTLEPITGPLRTGALEDLRNHVLSRQMGGIIGRPMRGRCDFVELCCYSDRIISLVVEQDSCGGGRISRGCELDQDHVRLCSPAEWTSGP